jgi:hypothetical protein
VTNLTTSDISGFVNVVGAIIAIFGVIVAHFAHRSAVPHSSTAPEIRLKRAAYEWLFDISTRPKTGRLGSP